MKARRLAAIVAGAMIAALTVAAVFAAYLDRVWTAAGCLVLARCIIEFGTRYRRARPVDD